MKKIIYSPLAPAPLGPYSQAIQVNDLVFLSGQVALDSKGNLVNETLEMEVRQVMDNLKAVLAAAGLDFKDVVKTSIFLTDMGNFQLVNRVYGEYFEQEPPARETVEVSALPKGVRVEIACVACGSD